MAAKKRPRGRPPLPKGQEREGTLQIRLREAERRVYWKRPPERSVSPSQRGRDLSPGRRRPRYSLTWSARGSDPAGQGVKSGTGNLRAPRRAPRNQPPGSPNSFGAQVTGPIPRCTKRTYCTKRTKRTILRLTGGERVNVWTRRNASDGSIVGERKGEGKDNESGRTGAISNATASEVCKEFSDTLNRVVYRDETVLIERRGQPGSP